MTPLALLVFLLHVRALANLTFVHMLVLFLVPKVAQVAC